jgi:5-methylcytosine-specific restriction enzyme subunit McrC
MSQIPIQNLYYLLSYAWSHFHAGPETDIAAASCPDLENLLAKVLANGIHRLARTGFERAYLPFQETTPRLKGRIQVASSHRRMTHRAGRMICEFDDLSHDTAANRILRAVAKRLVKAETLTRENRHELRLALGILPEVGELAVTDASFQRVQLHRNTRNYRIVLDICRLIHQSFLPEESAGCRRFRDILRDETLMHALFEAFVRNFAARHCAGAGVSQMHIRWQATGTGDDLAAFLPWMFTDVTIAWPHRKLILDCKYYADALSRRDNRSKFHSPNLYQLHAYLTNKGAEPGWETVEGMLLYPTNGFALDHCFTLHGRHRVRIATIDLQQPWPCIERDLLRLLDGGSHSGG